MQPFLTAFYKSFGSTAILLPKLIYYMKYLKLFDTESNYLTYRNGSDYLKPNVSLSDDNGDVYYNYPPPNYL